MRPASPAARPPRRPTGARGRSERGGVRNLGSRSSAAACGYLLGATLCGFGRPARGPGGTTVRTSWTGGGGAGQFVAGPGAWAASDWSHVSDGKANVLKAMLIMLTDRTDPRQLKTGTTSEGIFGSPVRRSRGVGQLVGRAGAAQPTVN